MKKIVIAVLSAVVALSAFASCGDSSSRTEGEKVTLSSSSSNAEKGKVVEEADFLGAFMGETADSSPLTWAKGRRSLPAESSWAERQV